MTLPALTLLIVHVVNLVISIASWPEAWKMADIVPVCKAGKPPTGLSSYRPVALLSSLHALFKIYEQLEEHELLPVNRHGFRKRHSIDTA